MKTLGQHPVILATVAILAFVVLIIGRVAAQSRAELALAQASRQGGDDARAIEHYRRALRWSFPLGRQTTEAELALESIARASEAEGNIARALLAWRSLAGSLAATRFLYLRTDPARDKAKDEIARLLSLDRSAAIDAGLDAEKLAADHRRLLGDEPSPDSFWGTLLLLGFAIWTGSLVVLARTGFDSDGRLQWVSARGPLWGALAGFASFVLGLLFA